MLLRRVYFFPNSLLGISPKNFVDDDITPPKAIEHEIGAST